MAGEYYSSASTTPFSGTQLDREALAVPQKITFDPGDRFRIGTNDKNFNGDIALILVYDSWIDKESQNHEDIVTAIKSNYPSLAI